MFQLTYMTNGPLFCSLGPQEDLYFARYLPGRRGRLSLEMGIRTPEDMFMYEQNRLFMTSKDLVGELIRCQYYPLRRRG